MVMKKYLMTVKRMVIGIKNNHRGELFSDSNESQKRVFTKLNTSKENCSYLCKLKLAKIGCTRFVTCK